jgi:hypothetical protein
MDERETYYCWVRILPATEDSEQVPPHDRDFQEKMFEIRAPHRPPRVSAVGAESAGLKVSFFADQWFIGDATADSVIDYGPAYAERCEAIDWFAKHGEQWTKRALNFFLFCLERESKPKKEKSA